MFTAHSVGARHLAIKPVIGTFEEEDEAFDKMMLLTWLMPLLVAVATTIDGVLMAMMMTVLHPWRRILQEVRNNLLAFFITLQEPHTTDVLNTTARNGQDRAGGFGGSLF